MALSERQYHAVLDLVGEAHHAQSRPELRSLLLPALKRMVPADYASYNEIAPGESAQVAITDPELPASVHEAWGRHALRNPLVARFMRTRDTRPYRFSDVADLRVLHHDPLFREVYDPIGLRHQIAFGLPSPPTLTIGIALSRCGPRDFGDDERTMLDLARPHLIQAYRNAALRESLAGTVDALVGTLDRRAIAALVLDPHGRLVAASRRARRLACELGGPEPVLGEPLPAALRRELEDGSRLLAQPVDMPDGTRALLVDVPAAALAPAELVLLGLTPREAEVLSRLAGGAATVEVAAALGVSPRTVEKHCERIHRKLGVRDRSAAVAAAWAAVMAGRT